MQQLIASPPSDENKFKGKLQGLINLLRTIKPRKTAYTEAQQFLSYAQKQLQSL